MKEISERTHTTAVKPEAMPARSPVPRSEASQRRRGALTRMDSSPAVSAEFPLPCGKAFIDFRESCGCRNLNRRGTHAVGVV